MILLILSLFPPSEIKGIYLNPAVLQNGTLEKQIFYYTQKDYINTLVIDVRMLRGRYFLKITVIKNL